MILLLVLYKIWPLPFHYLAKSVLLPSANVIVVSARKIYSPVQLLVDLNSLDRKNKSLEQENISLEAENAKLRDDSREATQLLSETDASKSFKNIIIARVVSRTPGGFSQKVIINKGAADNITAGAAVLCQGYFTGRVTSIERNRSEVELIFSHNSRIPVRMEKNPEGGLLQGGLEGLTVTDIPVNSKAETGDNVLTSGLGGEIPSGLLVGKVGLHLGLEGELFQKVRVTSPINPYSIGFVSVLSNEL
jgi:rod shape-determining protein MreC